MQIRLRPSGGRGEYELAGSHGSIRGSDLYGLEIWLDFGLNLRIPLHAIAAIHDGKPRIRLIDPQRHTHAARLISAVLLLPLPIREIRKTTASDTLDLKSCAFSSISVDVVTKTSSLVVLRPRIVVAINSLGATKAIDVIDRFEYVEALWDAASLASTELEVLLCQHRAECLALSSDHGKLLKTAIDVLRALDAVSPSTQLQDSDISRSVAGLFDLSESVNEDDSSSPIQVNREVRKRLILRAERGIEGRRFRNAVTTAYDFRCAFSGLRLPPLASGSSPGVDAAHIFPWSLRGSNQADNGLCLSKLMHWAFDEGVLRLTHQEEDGTLLIGLGSNVEKQAIEANFDLSHFAGVCGVIPESRLPQDPVLRPSKKAIAAYNALLFPPL